MKTIMIRLTFLLVLIGTAIASDALAQLGGAGDGKHDLEKSTASKCRACNIMEEGLFNRDLIGQVVYQKQPKRFHPVKILGITTLPYRMVRYRAVETGQTGETDASIHFSEARMRELIADSGQANGGEYDSEFDRNDRETVEAACQIYLNAKSSEGVAAAASASVFRGACCESSASRRTGMADKPICKQ